MSADPHRPAVSDPVPQRLSVRGAAGMRALAHPARLKSLQRLAAHGPATATELGEVVGLTPSAMSYHLRALERAELISKAPSRGDGRERVWQSNFPEGWGIDSMDDGTDDTRTASVELLEAVLAVEELDVRQWLSHAGEPGWLDTGAFVSTTVVVNQQELEAITRQISAVLEPYGTRQRAMADRPSDAVSMRASFRGFPSGEALPEGDAKH